MDEFTEYTVICHTDGCENADIPIDVYADPESPLVICGPCSQQITDVTPIK